MYKLTDAKRAINSINHIIKEANNYVIDLAKNSILDEIELNNKQKEELEQIFFNIKDQISENNLLTTIQDKKKRKKINREPSKYNLFIKDNIALVKERNPNLNNKEALSKAAMLWNEKKIENLNLQDK
jgi:ABC-type uncharacterized transport system substrate-binding protein